MIKLGEMILDLHRQGLSVSAIAKATGADRKTVRKYIERGLEAPVYGPRKPRQAVVDLFTSYLRERVIRCPRLTGRRLFRELKDLVYSGGYTAVTDFHADRAPRLLLENASSWLRRSWRRTRTRPLSSSQWI